MNFTPAVFLAVFLAYCPQRDPEELKRVAVVSVAAYQAQQTLLKSKRWPGSEAELAGAIATGVIRESGLWHDTHDGSRIGRAGEICLMQIHPTNPAWKLFTSSRKNLAGTDLESTRLCLLTGAESLTRSARHCLGKRYFKNWRQAMWTMYHYGSRCWLSPHAYPRTRTMARIASKRWVVTEEHERLVSEVLKEEDNDRTSTKQATSDRESEDERP